MKSTFARPEFGEDPLSLVSRLGQKLHTLWLAWTYPFAHLGTSVTVNRSCEIARSRAPYIRIGDQVILGKDVWLNIPDTSICRDAAIILENGCAIGRRSVISARNHIHVHQNTLFAPSVLVMDHNHAFDDVTTPVSQQSMTPGGTIRIEEGCWIGFGAAVVCNRGELVIGKNSVVGANSFVNRSVPEYSVVTGNPARIVKRFDPATKRWIIPTLTEQRVHSSVPAMSESC